MPDNADQVLGTELRNIPRVAKDCAETYRLTILLGNAKGLARVPLSAFENFRGAESAGKHYKAFFKPFFEAGGLNRFNGMR